MVVLVEAVALEGDTDLREDLLDLGTTHVGIASMGLGTDRQGVLGEGLPGLKHLAGALTAVVIGWHGTEDTGTGAARHRTIWPCGWP